eukprot:TRINITY_DN6565_c0_g1_i1.p1 TRINITY_DN6565_c0_g1~~TRINITY_DN6565_c0_g1_i1.p1  ORF type:complete len:128 (-),score=15.56 TRINITY_DN6565_c0_g1_i1:16-399(-)
MSQVSCPNVESMLNTTQLSFPAGTLQIGLYSFTLQFASPTTNRISQTSILLNVTENLNTKMSIQSPNYPYIPSFGIQEAVRLVVVPFDTVTLPATYDYEWRLNDTILKIGRAVQQECRDRSRMPSSA